MLRIFSDPITLFAPSNQAFEALGPVVLQNLLRSPESLKQILLSHVISDRLYIGDLYDGLRAASKAGNLALFSVTPSDVRINSAILRNSDIAGSNGIIHIIDRVLLPPYNNLLQAEVIYSVLEKSKTYLL